MSKNIFKTVIAAFVAVAMSAMFSMSAFAASPAKDLNGRCIPTVTLLHTVRKRFAVRTAVPIVIRTR